MRIKGQDVAEDTRECTPEEAPDPLVNKPASFCGLIFQAGHDSSKDVEMAGVVALMRVRSALIANSTQGIVGFDA